MEKKAESTISELNRRIESLQAKRDAVIRKEKERKAKAQEKWKMLFMKAFIPHVVETFGEDYEDVILPERLADALERYLGQMKELTELKALPEETPMRKEDETSAALRSEAVSDPGPVLLKGEDAHE